MGDIVQLNWFHPRNLKKTVIKPLYSNMIKYNNVNREKAFKEIQVGDRTS